MREELVFVLGSFKEAIEFLNEVSIMIEDRHHPLIKIDGKRVTISIDKDVKLIAAIERAYKNYSESYLDEKELDLLKMEEEKEKAKHRSRGPYRKSSSAGLI